MDLETLKKLFEYCEEESASESESENEDSEDEE